MNFSLANCAKWISKQLGFWQRRGGKFIALSLIAFFTVTASLLIFTTQAQAVDEIKIKYGAASLGVTVVDLENFAATGTQSDQIRSLFLTANATEAQIAEVRKFLTYNVEINPNLLKEALNSYYGQLVLKEMSKYISAGSDADVIVKDVLTAANSTIADGKINALEILKNYKGTNSLVVDAKPLVEIYTMAMKEADKLITFVRTDPDVQKFLCQTK